MLRSFNWFAFKEADILKQSAKPEWPAFLHNLAYLHGAIRLRARFGRGGWNVPTDFRQIGNTEFRVSFHNTWWDLMKIRFERRQIELVDLLHWSHILVVPEIFWSHVYLTILSA